MTWKYVLVQQRCLRLVKEDIASNTGRSRVFFSCYTDNLLARTFHTRRGTEKWWWLFFGRFPTVRVIEIQRDLGTAWSSSEPLHKARILFWRSTAHSTFLCAPLSAAPEEQTGGLEVVASDYIPLWAPGNSRKYNQMWSCTLRACRSNICY